MAKLSFLVGFGAGYVLGAKAGRERYEQIRRMWSDAKDNPQLQGLAGMAQARADDVVSSVKSKMGRDTTPDTGTATRSTGTTTTPPATATSSPDVTALPVDPPPIV